MKLTLPLSVVMPRKTKKDKVFYLNVNTYRNAHYRVLDAAKKLYEDEVLNALLDYDPTRRVTEFFRGPNKLTYTLFPPSVASNRIQDLANVLPIVQKFTDDALITFGVLQDDNLNVVREIDYRFGEVDKAHPRAELLIESIRR
jgi:hypothetical protein